MSQTVWLEPSSQKTVYLQVRNTSDKDMSDLEPMLAQDSARERLYRDVKS